MVPATLQVRKEVVVRDPDPDPDHTHTESGGTAMMLTYGVSRWTTVVQRGIEGEGFHEEVLRDP